MQWPLPKPTSTSSCTLLFLLSLGVLALYTSLRDHQPGGSHNVTAAKKNSENAFYYQNVFLSSATNYTLSTYLRHLTLHPHLAGTAASLQTAMYVKSHFESLNLSTHVNTYAALLSYPTHSSLSAHFRSNDSVTVKVLQLSEPGSSQAGVVRPYHAYSPSGSAYGKAVFVNLGREEDYAVLAALGLEVKGCVAIVRRRVGGDLSRNVVVEKAEEKGVAVVLMYTEGDSRSFRQGVERGTVMKGLGDPLTPGWAGVEYGERLGLEDHEVVKRFPRVPSMPISAATAEDILSTLEGAKVPYEWGQTKVGPGPTMLNFTYQGEEKLETVRNVFAVIRGSEEPDRFVLLGNHRDAWTYGAVDPNSGTAALLDIARRFALLRRRGWNPRRTIILCSWDAEEFGMVGSTEWVEQNLVNLGTKAVAYLNVDCAVQGPGFFAGASPQLDDLLVEVIKKVKDPDTEELTLYDKWKETSRSPDIHRLSGVDSDFAPFLQHAGVPSVDLYYGKDYPVYHTAFDSYNWMVKIGDPFFQRHVAVAGIWGLLSLHLADDSILAFNYISYAAQLQEYTNIMGNLLHESISLHPLTAAIQELMAAAKEAEEEAKYVREQENMSNVMVLKKRALNDRLMLAERGFLDVEGLRGRPWFKHLVYGPHGDSQSKLGFFPGIVDAAISQSTRMNESERQATIKHEIWRVARSIQRAAHALKGELT